MIGLEPSCIATFRDEYPDLLQSDDARAVAANSFFIEEFLLRQHDRGDFQMPWAPIEPCKILVHGHCYQKALTGDRAACCACCA